MGNVNTTSDVKNVVSGKEPVTSKKIYFKDVISIIQKEITEWDDIIQSLETKVTTKQKQIFRNKMVDTAQKLNQFLSEKILTFEDSAITSKTKTSVDGSKPEIKAKPQTAVTKVQSKAEKAKAKSTEPDKPTSLEKQISMLTEERDKAKNELEEEKLENAKLLDTVHGLEKDNKELEENFKKLADEKENIFLRLSRIAGDKLTKDNPDIANLSDKNRPTKLGELYGELYDNEWTDALEGLHDSGYDEKESVLILHQTLLNVFDFCEFKAKMLIKKTSDAVNLLFDENSINKDMDATTVEKTSKSEMQTEEFPLQHRWKGKVKAESSSDGSTVLENLTPARIDVEDKMKDLRKEVAESLVPIVQKAYFETKWDSECLSQLIPYLKKSLYICWMMVVQSPALCLHDASSQETINTNLYKPFTMSGKKLDFVVWPALLLHKDGNVVAKGIAQAKNEKE